MRGRNIWKRLAAGLIGAALLAGTLPAGLLPEGTARAEEGSTATGRELLKRTLDYCAGMDESKYDADAWSAFQETLTQAKEAYEANELDDDGFYALRDSVEDVKTDLTFVPVGGGGNPRPFTELSTDEIVFQMGTGWNLGNTMDGHTGFTPNETLWQNVETTKQLMKAVHDAGFNTVRIPVTWGTMIRDEDYSIDEKWISRVQDIVDYAIAQDMYVIINVHHDGAEQTGWLRVASDDIDTVYEKFEGVWRTIALRFRDYDEHLIFESMNEVQGDSSTTVEHDVQVIMNLNQIFVNVVRSTGSNNEKRFLSVPARYTNIGVTTDPANHFSIPEDTVEDRIFVAVHYYDWNFGMLENMDTNEWFGTSVTSLEKDFVKLSDCFTSKGIPVIMGEYGCINKNNPAQRAYHVEIVNRLCRKYGVVPVYWDQGWYDRSREPADYSFTLIDRETCELVDPEVTHAIMRGMFLGGELSDITVAPEIREITDAPLPDAVMLAVGELRKQETSASPDGSGDVLLWSTDNADIATVSNGIIRGRGIGTTTIHVRSQSGSFGKDIAVTVTALEGSCSEITTAYDGGAVLEAGQYAYLDAALSGGSEGNFVTYRSADEEIATVSSTGKIVAKSAGSTYIVLTAATGMTKVIPVTVVAGEAEEEISLALNVYFNDEEHGYFSNEYGESIRVTGDGQYELTFDCTQDLSGNAAAAGVTSLHNLTAIYIKDHAVTLGEAKTSPLSSCNIMFDSVVVDGIPLTVTQETPKSALKASGIFDTNDPLNSWDGSQVAEVEVSSNHVLNITGVTDPKKIVVTFTLSDMVFTEITQEPQDAEPVRAESITVPARELTIEGSRTVPVGGADGIRADGAEGARLVLVAQDASVVAVPNEAFTYTESGAPGLTLTALKEGRTTVTVYAENGVTVSFDVVCSLVSESAGETGEGMQGEGTQDTGEQSAPEESGGARQEADGAGAGEASGTAASGGKKTSGISTAAVILISVIAAALSGFGVFFATTRLGGKKQSDTQRKKEKDTESEKKNDAER